MPLIQWRSERTQQPESAVGLGADWLRRACFAANASHGLRDLTTGQPLALSLVGQMDAVPRSGGIAWNHLGNAAHSLSLASNRYATSKPSTLVAVCEFRSGGPNYSTLISEDIGSIAWFGGMLRTDLGVPTFYYGGNTGGTFSSVSVGGGPLTQAEGVVTIVGVRAGNTISVYATKRPPNSATISFTPNAQITAFRIGQSSHDTREVWLGPIYLAASLEVALTPREAQLLADNPWQLFAPQTRRIWVPGAGGGAQTVTPTKGAVVLGGKTPTVSQTANQTAAPAKGALTLVGYVPAVAQTANQQAQPTKGALTLTGQVPVVSQTANQQVQPLKGAVVFTGYVPDVSNGSGQNVSPGTGHAVLTGYAPDIATTANQVVRPSSGHVVLLGKIPGVTQSGEPVWPLESDVRQGVQYGPTGVEYTGALQAGGGSFLRRR